VRAKSILGLLRGWFICQIEMLEMKSKLEIEMFAVCVCVYFILVSSQNLKHMGRTTQFPRVGGLRWVMGSPLFLRDYNLF
jgi:hypothetical protein